MDSLHNNVLKFFPKSKPKPKIKKLLSVVIEV